MAAGRGSRLGHRSGTPKMLHLLLGVPLVERAVRTLFELGLEEVVVVYGAHPAVGDYCRKALADRFRGGSLKVVFASRWQEGNGASLAAVEPYVEADEAFISVSGDHFTTSDCLRALLDAQAPSVLVDSPGRPGIDDEEATKVLSDPDGTVVDIGKDVTGRPGYVLSVDAGAHLLTPAVFPHLGPRPDGGEVSLTSALRAIAHTGALRTVRVPQGSSWQDIDTPSDLKWAKRKALGSLRSDKDGLVARLLNRPLSLAITSVVSRWRPSPNAISIVAFMVAVVAALVAAVGAVPGIVPGLLVQAASVVDGVDGELARATFRSSRFGRLLDGVLDRIGDTVICLGVGLRALDFGASPRAVVALVAASVGGSLLSMASKDRAALVLPGEMRPRLEGVERAIGNLLAGRDGRLLVIAVTVTLGAPLMGLALVSCVAWLGVLLRVAAVGRVVGTGSS